MSEADGERGELPEGWEWRRVGDLATSITNGFACGGHNRTGDGVPHLRPMNVSPDFAMDLSDTVYIPAEDAVSGVVIEKGDVLFTNTSSQAVVGKSAVYDLPVPRAFSNHMTRIRVDRALIDPEWLVSSFWLLWKRGEFHSLCRNHVNQSSIARSALREILIATPDISEQRRILETVSPMLKEVDRQRTRLERLRGVVGRARRSVLAAAFRGELTEVEPRVRSEIDPPDEAMPSIPESWTWDTTAALAQHGVAISYGIVLPGPEIPGGVPYVRQHDIEDGWIQTAALRHTTGEIAKKHSRSALAEGDILLCIIRHLRVALVPASLAGANITQGAVRIRVSSRIERRFLFWWLRGPYAQQWMRDRYTGTDMPRINVEDTRSIPVPVPPIEEQQEIVRIVDRWFAVLDDVERRIARGLALCDRLRESLLQKAFRGELLPPTTATRGAATNTASQPHGA